MENPYVEDTRRIVKIYSEAIPSGPTIGSSEEEEGGGKLPQLLAEGIVNSAQETLDWDTLLRENEPALLEMGETADNVRAQLDQGDLKERVEQLLSTMSR